MPKITELPGKQEKGDMKMSEFKTIETQEELDNIVKERIRREREKFGDYDDLRNVFQNWNLKTVL